MVHASQKAGQARDSPHERMDLQSKTKGKLLGADAHAAAAAADERPLRCDLQWYV
jgi:hypothetical protein